MICIQFAFTCREPARFLSFQETRSLSWGFSVPLTPTPQTLTGPEPPVLTEDPRHSAWTWALRGCWTGLAAAGVTWPSMDGNQEPLPSGHF